MKRKIKVNCLGCGKEFEGLPHIVNGTPKRKGKRFCSKYCFFKWTHKNAVFIFNHTELVCDNCKKIFYKPKFRVKKTHNYCCRLCADKKHGETIKGGEKLSLAWRCKYRKKIKRLARTKNKNYRSTKM